MNKKECKKNKVYASNKKALFDYEIVQKYNAGIVLKGYEVKSIKTGNISLKGSFVYIKDNEIFLTNALIPLYKFATNIKDYDPLRTRKLLMKKNEILQLLEKKKAEGLTIVPIMVYNSCNRIKVEIALARGKKKHDKRHAIAEKDSKRKMQRVAKNFRIS